MKRFGMLLVIFSAIACNNNTESRKEQERIVIAELQKQNQALLTSMQEVDLMLDSINQTLRCVAKEGLSDNSTSTERLVEINAFIQQAASTMKYQEQQIRNIKIEAEAYLMMMDALKSEAEIRESHLMNVTDSLQTFKVLANNEEPSL